MSPFRGHQLKLYLTKQLEQAVVHLRAEKGLGRSYAGLRIFAEGAYQLGLIQERVYRELCGRYDKPLVNEKTLPEFVEKEKLDKVLASVIEQWMEHTDVAWRHNWIDVALQNRDLRNARRLLEMTKAMEVMS